jgi:hydroxymethylpyrimidine pyrophosphatase-like HAD family hydrolase
MKDWIATDLDSSIFSRAWYSEDAIPATWNFESDSTRVPSSWMRPETYRLLQALSQSFVLVSVTARHQESFDRVEVSNLKLNGPAIIANGAIILGWDGLPDRIWEEKIIALLTPWKPILEEFCAWLIEKSLGQARPRLIPGPANFPAYLVAKAEPGWWHTAAGESLRSEMDWLGCRVEVLGTELQVLPPGIGKRDATLEMQHRFFAGQAPLLCIGDMPLDLDFMRLGGLLATPVGSTIDQIW